MASILLRSATSSAQKGGKAVIQGEKQSGRGNHKPNQVNVDEDKNIDATNTVLMACLQTAIIFSNYKYIYIPHLLLVQRADHRGVEVSGSVGRWLVLNGLAKKQMRRQRRRKKERGREGMNKKTAVYEETWICLKFRVILGYSSRDQSNTLSCTRAHSLSSPIPWLCPCEMQTCGGAP